MKKLSGNTGTIGDTTVNTTILAIEKSSTPAPADKREADNVVSTASNATYPSNLPIYMWFESGTIYWWSEADNVYLNPDSSHLFYFLDGNFDISQSDFDTSKVIDMRYMFACKNITSLDLSNWTTSTSVNKLGYMFNGCSNLLSLDLRGFNTSNVTSMVSTFQNCSNIQTIYVSSLWSTAKLSNVSNSLNMFTGCSSIVGGNGTVYDSTVTNKTYACIDTASTPGYFTEAI